ncbi:MAG TPA: hypothetical protein VF041_14005 [Gemmatimonadaceae bacterium]
MTEFEPFTPPTQPHPARPPKGLDHPTPAPAARGDGSHVDADPRTLHVAVVRAIDDIRLVAAASTRGALLAPLAVYVERCADAQLAPESAERVRRLLRAGHLDTAISLYFACVGDRWDEEWLDIREVDLAS